MQTERYRTLIFAVSAGISVANMYYCQPLLEEMASAMGTTISVIGGVTVATQIGTALGMLLFVPLGDRFERRRLIVMMCVASSVAALLVGIAPTVGCLIASSAVIGLTSVVPHLLIPFAAELSPLDHRGKTVGTVVGGLLVGIVSSRTISGTIASFFGWRMVYVIAAGLMMTLALALARWLPKSTSAVDIGYRKLFQSIATLFVSRREVRIAALSGGLLFGAFSAFWTTLVFLLAAPPYQYSTRAIGAFGLLAVVSALVAPWMGRFVDRRSADEGVLMGAAFLVAAFAVLATFANRIFGLVVGTILLDTGVQAAHVANQARLYAAFTTTRGRAVTIYMMTYFCGGALGSALGIRTYASSGWSSVCVLGGSFALVACLPIAANMWRNNNENVSQGQNHQNHDLAK